MKSFLDVDGGVYTPGRRYAFTNTTDEDFTSYWSKVPIVVKPGETIEISDSTPFPGSGMGHMLSIKMTGELVDKIMLTDVKRKETEYYKANPGATYNSFRAPNSVGVPAARKPFEDQVLRELAVDEESPAIQVFKKQLEEEIQRGIDGVGESVPVPTNIEEFAEIKKFNKVTPKEVKPVKTKKLETSISSTNKGK
jgi:hypothetical protein